ncbi:MULTISPECIES: hypothetical protein [Bacillus cereus group]|nr:hypothetical protein [Bacillus cereus]HDT6613835.1 hypothetical protein [Bacillus paranthracis]ASK17790.1 hypothetical protein BA201_28150 [Bacillus cereus]MBL3786272.1 hypothetical protein [Bacillus cereus]MBL3802886.1 hypothetical protein [Bacillus cereus]MBL3817993.1 hypothetical protein [Bacillus cereus]
MEIEIMKELLAEQGFEGKQLDEMVEKARLKQEKLIEEELKNEEKLKTVEETVKLLEKSIGGTWNGPKVRRMIAAKQLKPVEENPAKRTGFRIHIKEIERFIEWESMSKEDWKKRCLDAEEQLLAAQKTIEQMKQENEKLKADLKAAKTNKKTTVAKAKQQQAAEKEQTNEKTDTKNEQDKKGV